MDHKAGLSVQRSSREPTHSGRGLSLPGGGHLEGTWVFSATSCLGWCGLVWGYCLPFCLVGCLFSGRRSYFPLIFAEMFIFKRCNFKKTHVNVYLCGKCFYIFDFFSPFSFEPSSQ